MTLLRSAIVLSVLFWLLPVVGGAVITPGYHWPSQYISELGASGSPHGGLINLAGFLPGGVLFALALGLAWQRRRPRGLLAAGMLLLFCEPLAWIGSALFPCDLGCPASGSIAQQVHSLLGLLTFVGTALGLVLLGSAPGLAMRRRLGCWLLAVVWLALFAAMVTPELAAIRGALQRTGEVLLYSVLAWQGWQLGRAPPPLLAGGR